MQSLSASPEKQVATESTRKARRSENKVSEPRMVRSSVIGMRPPMFITNAPTFRATDYKRKTDDNKRADSAERATCRVCIF
ncbi:hypothetical protein F2P81_005609 [Scophthalmus maximus]|uniref:Uncharacterized protein n=1 Tax=Scophthalmus maximus TaxID=52904 RepID=A0A6A4T725_SCOMX|nr:hypothetical protein F2P81_005609 [Scophthalmus maximus]